jgi:hypothetical protein
MLSPGIPQSMYGDGLSRAAGEAISLCFAPVFDVRGLFKR